MPDSLGTAYIDVQADTSGLGRSIDKGVTKATQNSTKALGGLTGQMKAVGAAAGLFIGGALIGAAGKIKAFADDAVRAFSELEQSTGSVESVFGDFADTIISQSQGAAQAFGLSAADFQESATLIGSMLKNQMGLSAEEAAGQVDDLIGKAADMAATFGGTTADAISAIGSLMRGERDPIEKFGVSMNDAAIEAHALEMGLAATNAELTPQMESAAALDLLYQQTGDSAGQFAEEADTLAGATQRANAEIENNKALVGQALQGAYRNVGIPLMSTFHEVLGDVAVAWMELTGEMSEAEAMLARLELDATATGLDQMRAVLEETNFQWGRAGQDPEKFYQVLRDGLIPLTLTQEDIEWFIQNLPAYAAAMGLTAEEEQGALEAAEDRLAILEQERIDLGRGRGREEEYATALRNSEEATRDLIDVTATHATKLRELADPMFNAINKVNDLQAAQQTLTELQNSETTPSAEDLAAAEIAVAEALLDAQGAMDQLDPAALNSSIDSIATALDKPREYVITLLENLGVLDGKTVNTYIEVHTTEHIRRITHQVTGGGTFEGLDPDREGQHGAPLAAGRPALVGEVGPELFIPNVSGHVIPNVQSMRMMRAGVSGGGVSLAPGAVQIIFQGMVNEQMALRAGRIAAEAVLDKLSREQVVA